MATTNHPRRQGREAVLQALYASEMSGDTRPKILKDIFERKHFDQKMKQFIKALFNSSLEHKEWCEGQIKSRLNNWEFNRIALLDRLLMVVAISEIYFVDDVPPKVSISEAIEIAKEYSTEDSASFVNGVLDNIYKSIPVDNKEVAL